MHTREDDIEREERVVGERFAHALEGALQLQDIDPKHELLKFMFDGEDGTVWDEFQVRFGKPEMDKATRGSKLAIAHCLAQYHQTVTAELQKLRLAART